MLWADFENMVYDALEDDKPIFFYCRDLCFLAYADISGKDKIYLSTTSEHAGVTSKFFSMAEFGAIIKLLWGAGFVPQKGKREPKGSASLLKSVTLTERKYYEIFGNE